MEPITSRSQPLPIGEVKATRQGVLGLTYCPGKRQKQSIYGTWMRDLDIDLGAVRDWGASSVVTLMPREELDFVEAGRIGEICARLGMEWIHLPIRDLDIPDRHFEAHWATIGPRLVRDLRQGRKILIHCRGGLGRTGTVAARLLVELGWEKAAAIAGVRRARPGAIETESQLNYVLGLRVEE